MSTMIRFMMGVLFLFAGVGSGCAHGSKAQAFMPLTDFQEGQGIVYVYRPKNFVGSAVSYKVHANGTAYSPLPNGRYFVYEGSGAVEFTAKTEMQASVTIDVQPEQVYYVKGGVVPGIMVGNPVLQQVSTEVGEREIVRCKLAPPLK